ncbi:MAG: glycoside hydrolase family 43 protein [Hungatella sp.]
MEYKNPVMSGFYPDPSVCRVGNGFYMVNSSFEYLPGIPVSYSTDLVHWRKIGYCITRKSQMDFKGAKASEGLWAPTIRYHEGVFYVIGTRASLGEKRNFYVTSTHPEQGWSDPIWLDQDGIDPSLLFDEDGSVYLTSNGWGPEHDPSGRIVIQQSRIEIETGRTLTPPRTISYGAGGRCAEAPHLYNIKGMYYLVLAEGGTELGHMVTVFRSQAPWGPFEACPFNPILTAKDEGAPKLSGTGHGELVEDAAGNWWMVFLCYRIATVKYHHLGRETGLVPIAWEHGWPIPVGGRNPKELIQIPELSEIALQPAAEVFQDEFDKPELNLEWNYMREFSDAYKINPSKKELILHGTKENLSAQGSPAFIGRRQCHMEMEFSVELEFVPKDEQEEAGIAVICSNRAHYDLGIRKTSGKRVVRLHKVVEDMEVCLESEIELEGNVTLFIRSDRETYYFGIISQDGRKLEVGTGMTKLLSSEVIWGFTGVLIGLYATGNGRNLETPASFHNCRYVGGMGADENNN